MPTNHRLVHADIGKRPPTRRFHGALFSLSVSPLPSGVAKFACTVSKKTAGKAVERNLLKRQCREALRPHLARLNRPLAIVLQAKKTAVGASFAMIREDIAKLVQSLQ